jgi:hypothetical protein
MSAYKDWINSLSHDECADKIENEWEIAEYAFNAGMEYAAKIAEKDGTIFADEVIRKEIDFNCGE